MPRDRVELAVARGLRSRAACELPLGLGRKTHADLAAEVGRLRPSGQDRKPAARVLRGVWLVADRSGGEGHGPVGSGDRRLAGDDLVSLLIDKLDAAAHHDRRTAADLDLGAFDGTLHALRSSLRARAHHLRPLLAGDFIATEVVRFGERHAVSGNLVREGLCVASALAHHELPRRHEQHLDARGLVAHAPRKARLRDRVAQRGIGDDLRVDILLDHFTPIERRGSAGRRCSGGSGSRGRGRNRRHGRRGHGDGGRRGLCSGRRLHSDRARRRHRTRQRRSQRRRVGRVLHEHRVPHAVEILGAGAEAFALHGALVRSTVVHRHDHAPAIHGHDFLEHAQAGLVERDRAGVVERLRLLEHLLDEVARVELRVAAHRELLDVLLEVRLRGDGLVLELRRNDHAVDDVHHAASDGNVAGHDARLERLFHRTVGV